MNNLSYAAMLFAREIHAQQTRKYTGNPYVDHLAEVAGIAMSVGWHQSLVHPDTFMAVCWLHDSMEDQPVTHDTLTARFGIDVADGVRWLTDHEIGNRAERKRASCERLSHAPGWIQTIKCADLISNTASIRQHDPKFAEIYFTEKRALLEVLTGADVRLVDLARAQVQP